VDGENLNREPQPASDDVGGDPACWAALLCP